MFGEDYNPLMRRFLPFLYCSAVLKYSYHTMSVVPLFSKQSLLDRGKYPSVQHRMSAVQHLRGSAECGYLCRWPASWLADARFDTPPRSSQCLSLPYQGCAYPLDVLAMMWTDPTVRLCSLAELSQAADLITCANVDKQWFVNQVAECAQSIPRILSMTSVANVAFIILYYRNTPPSHCQAVLASEHLIALQTLVTQWRREM